MTRRRGWNEGTIYQLNTGRWRAQVSIAGKRLSYSAKTQAECIRWQKTVLTKSQDNFDKTGCSQSLGDYLPEWLSSKKSTLRPKTVVQYEQIIRLHVVPKIGWVKLRDLNLAQVDQFYGDLLKQGVGLRTIRLTHSVLHAALERAVRYSLIASNPAHGANVPKEVSTEMIALDEEQVSRFLTAAANSRYRVLFHLAVVTGMRQGELLGLKWADISWIKATISVRRQVQRVTRQGFVFSEPKTKAGRRMIGLGENALDQLRQQKELQMELKAHAKERWKENDLVFSSEVGTPLDQRNVLREFYVVLERAGLPKIRFHDLRHTAASLLLNNGQGIMSVSKLLGHSKPSVTVDIYGHLYNETMVEVARVMDRLVTPTPILLPEKQAAEFTIRHEVRKLHQIAPGG